jgi:short-subunit dehydrogenase
VLAVAGATAAVTAAAVFARLRRSRPNPLRGQVVIVTGSSRGLGLALAEEFLRRGSRIVLTARDPEELQRARQLLWKHKAISDSENVLIIAADLRDPEQARGLIERVTEAWGGVDVLVNNAGIITVGPVENQRIEDFHEVMDANFFSGMHTTLSVLPQMLDRNAGTIVNITSIGGKVPVPHLLPYTASKFAAVGFSEGLHAELRSKGVHVLTVCPGLMRTGSHLNAFFTGDAAREYRWFSRGATMPVISASARHAARRIVQAVLNRETEIFITPQAAVMGRLAHLAPSLTGCSMSLVNRILPEPAANPTPVQPGAAVRDREPASARTFGWAAARRYNEVGSTASTR